jgi:uncharacterized SAM-binding protein YcdF (DUF218 family)
MTVDPDDEPAGRRWSLRSVSRPRSKPTIALTLAALAVATSFYGYWVGWAPSDDYTTADAVIVHAGQRHRQRLASRLMDEGVAPGLVLLFASGYLGDDADTLCQDQPDFTVLCPVPDRADTVGEAIAIDRLADENDWDTVIVVTSNYHLRRAVLLDRRCSDRSILGVGARPRTFSVHLQATMKEMLALPIDLLSSCDPG